MAATYSPIIASYGTSQSSGWGSTTPPNYGLDYNLQQNDLLNNQGSIGGVSNAIVGAGGNMPVPGSNAFSQGTGYASTYDPNTPGASASSLAAPTTADILDQLAGKVSSGTTNTLADYGAQRGAGGGFGVDSPNSNAATMRALGLTAEGQVQQGITNSFSQQGIDNQSSQYNTTLQNTKDQFAASLGLDYNKLNEQQREFVDSQAQQALQFQQQMQLQWAALNQRGSGLGGHNSGGNGNTGKTPGTATGSGGGNLPTPYQTSGGGDSTTWPGGTAPDGSFTSTTPGGSSEVWTNQDWSGLFGDPYSGGGVAPDNTYYDSGTDTSNYGYGYDY